MTDILIQRDGKLIPCDCGGCESARRDKEVPEWAQAAAQVGFYLDQHIPNEVTHAPDFDKWT